MPSHQSAVSTLIREVLADPDLAHDEVFRRLLQAGLQDLVDAEPDLTAFAAFPREHWTKIWSNNPIERLNREIKRRADVVQVFPDSDSARPLIGSVLSEQLRSGSTANDATCPRPHCAA